MSQLQIQNLLLEIGNWGDRPKCQCRATGGLCLASYRAPALSPLEKHSCKTTIGKSVVTKTVVKAESCPNGGAGLVPDGKSNSHSLG